jgi:hypothetical protein
VVASRPVAAQAVVLSHRAAFHGRPAFSRHQNPQQILISLNLTRPSPLPGMLDSCMLYVLLGLASSGWLRPRALPALCCGPCRATCASGGWRWRSLQARPGFTPPLTLLKPLHGAEPGLEAHLATFFEQDYPEYEILFCARSADDAGLETARRVAARYPQIPAKFLSTGGQPDYINAKVASMERMEAEARTRFSSSATAMCA